MNTDFKQVLAAHSFIQEGTPCGCGGTLTITYRREKITIKVKPRITKFLVYDRGKEIHSGALSTLEDHLNTFLGQPDINQPQQCSGYKNSSQKGIG